MAKRRFKTRGKMLFTGLMLAGIIVYFAPQSLTNKLQFAFIHVFNKPLSICRNFTQSASAKQLSADTVDQTTYLKLQNHLANTMQWLRQERQNVEKLSGLRNRSVWEGADFVLADVITSFTDISRNEFIINRGENDGLAQGQFVLNNYSIIGIISELDDHIARVRLITDPRSKIVVKIGESDVQGVMRGNGNYSATIQLVPKKHKVENGDIIYIQKTPGFLDVPIRAATVANCKTNNENPLLWDIVVEPACDLQKVKSVTIVVMNSQK